MSLPDKRYLPRWEVQSRISCQLEADQTPHECVSRDLSSTGACLQTKELLPVNKRVKLTVYLSESNFINVDGRVLWSRVSSQGVLAGIVFEKILPQDQDLILQFAFEVKRQDLVKHWFSGWENPG